MKEVQLDVKKQSIHVQSPDYVLNHILPYQVDKENGNAKWDSSKEELQVTLPAIRKSIFDEI